MLNPEYDKHAVVFSSLPYVKFPVSFRTLSTSDPVFVLNYTFI